MKILNLNDQPIEPYDYLNAIPGGEVAEAQLPIYHGTVSGLPEGIDALIVASDLQGIVPVPRMEPHTITADAAAVSDMDALLGVMLPAHVRLLLEVEWPEIDPGHVGVLLCGDLYARRGKRGASGNPVPVWLAFREAFGWVAGVDGNHDLTDEAGAHRLHSGEGTHYMDVPAVIDAGPQVTAAAHRWPGRHYRQAGQAEPAAGEALPAIREQAAEAAAGLLAAAPEPGHS
jgi:hypothetical protein